MDEEKIGGEVMPTWTFLSNHAHVLLLIARDPEVKLREVACRVGITERAVQRIVADLEAGHYLERERAGRRNRYKVHPELPLRHPVEAHRDVGTLIELVMHSASRAVDARGKPPAPTVTPGPEGRINKAACPQERRTGTGSR